MYKLYNLQYTWLIFSRKIDTNVTLSHIVYDYNNNIIIYQVHSMYYEIKLIYFMSTSLF